MISAVTAGMAVERLRAGAFAVDVAEELGVSAWSVRSLARKAGLTLSKSAGLKHAYSLGARRDPAEWLTRYTLNEAAFEGELTPSLAWVLGVVAGDGCIVRRDDKLRGVDVVGDSDVCMKVAALLGSDAPVRPLKATCCNVRFHSPRLASSLARFGFGPAKTYDLALPELDEALLPHFVRGFWDADGCVTRTSLGRLQLSAVSVSPAFMRRLNAIVNTVIASNKKLTVVERPWHAPSYRLSVSAEKARLLGEWMWGESKEDARGARKYDSFQTLKDVHRG